MVDGDCRFVSVFHCYVSYVGIFVLFLFEDWMSQLVSTC